MKTTLTRSAAVLTGVTALFVMAATLVQAASPNGMWLRPKTGAHVQAFNCGSGLGLKIVKSKKAKDVGTVIMCSAKQTAPNKWQGNLKSTEDGNTYSGYVTLGGKKLRLEGCALAGLICKSEIWTRLR